MGVNGVLIITGFLSEQIPAHLTIHATVLEFLYDFVDFAVTCEVSKSWTPKFRPIRRIPRRHEYGDSERPGF